MADDNPRVRIEEVDWSSVLPILKLFGSFRMAIHPPKMCLALMLVVLVCMGGLILDGLWGREVYDGEFQQFISGDLESFEDWRERQEEAREVEEQALGLAITKRDESFVKQRDEIRSRISELPDEAEPTSEQKKQLREIQQERENLEQNRRDRLAEIRAQGKSFIFKTALGNEWRAFGRLVKAAATLNFGFGSLLGARLDAQTVVGSLREMLVTTPRWLYHTHLWLLLVMCLWILAVWSLLGGAISRMTAMHATRDDRPPAALAIRFAASRWAWYFLAPLMPLIVVLLLSLVLAVCGLIFGNLPVLDVIGALLFGFALVLGTVIALLLLGLAAGVSLLHPAIGVEGTDAFDAVSRVYSYVFGRPWHWIFYTGVSLVYGAICYLFVGLVVFLALFLTHQFAGWWVIAETADVNHFEAIMPQPQMGELTTFWPQFAALETSGKIAATLVLVWVWLFIGLLAAFAVSFYYSAHTWIYLLLRHSTDGTEFDDVFVEQSTSEGEGGIGDTAGPEKTEPTSDDQAPVGDDQSAASDDAST